MPWLRLFRVVNLPTVPGDVLSGAASAVVYAQLAVSPAMERSVFAAALSSVFIYMSALADNDIQGSRSDVNRPIPDGEIKLKTARFASVICLLAAATVAILAALPVWWYFAALILVASAFIYNRTKFAAVMGACRALNVVLGALSTGAFAPRSFIPVSVIAVVWWCYITWVTRFSAGEELDASLRAKVGFFIGAIVYLQLAVLVIFPVKSFLIAGAVMLIALRVLKILLPKVSAS